MAKKSIKFRIERARGKQFRLHIDGGNGEPALIGETVKNKKDLHDLITSIRTDAANAEVIDNAPEEMKMKGTPGKGTQLKSIGGSKLKPARYAKSKK